MSDYRGVGLQRFHSTLMICGQYPSYFDDLYGVP